MKPGDLVRNKNSERGELGLFLRDRTFKYHPSLISPDDSEEDKHYSCAEIYWPQRPRQHAISTIQTSLVEVINEKR